MSEHLITSVSVKTESDVEQKIIYPLLTNGNFLAIAERHVQTKNYLAPTNFEKRAQKTSGYYPDYSIWEKSFPLMLIEAKAPDVQVEVGYREAAGYAHHLNRKFRTGVNPCKYILACNGVRVLFGY